MISGITNLATLDAADLRQLFIDYVLRYERTEHIGRKNRIFGWRYEVAERLVELSQNSPRELLPLLKHQTAAVQLAVAYAIKPFDVALFIATLEALAKHGGQVGQEARSGLDWFKRQRQWGVAEPPASPLDPLRQPRPDWQRDNPPPPALSQAQLEDRVRTCFSDRKAVRIVELMRPAIGLWPQRFASPSSPLTSHIHGQAWAPPGWEWPIYDEEPLYFLSQIHLPDLAGMPGAELLPPSGVLAFFGDFDLIAGCVGEYGDAAQQAVHHWPTAGLRLVEPPLPLDHDPIETREMSIVPRPFIDLPHPASGSVENLGLSGDEEELYARIYDEVRYHGIPDEERDYCDVDDKLLGWPSLVQGDFFDIVEFGRDPYRQLVQLPARLGPGGSLYFLIREADLAARRFDRCMLTEQNT